jgi:hypothetical protein
VSASSIARRVLFAAGVCLLAAAAEAQPASVAAPLDRPFLFSVSASGDATRRAAVYVDTGVGERAFDLVQGDEPEQRIGVQAALGSRLTLLARIGVASDGGSVRASQQGELLYGVIQSPVRQTSLAIGMGMRHESQGINVLLARIAVGRSFQAWRLDGNALLEKPFATGRDAVDLITTLGVARQVRPSVAIGVELIGEDLEGFWEEDEAEGGARVLVGPSIRLAPPTARWQVGIAGGPVVHATRSTVRSDATRSLPDAGGRDGYAVRCRVTYGF